MLQEMIRQIDFEEELTVFLCSLIAFMILASFRNRKLSKDGKTVKHMTIDEEVVRAPSRQKQAQDEKVYGEVEKALRVAFEDENYWQVLKCWQKLKHFHQSSIHLPMIIRAMQACNKGASFIASELRNFFKAFPQELSIGLVNDHLESLSRCRENSQLVELLVRMFPSMNLVKDARTCEILLTMHASHGNVEKAQEVSSEMKSKGIVFTPRATVAIMTIGLQMGNLDVVFKTFVKLKCAWDVRETWAVSVFALERHKAHVLTQIVSLAFKAKRTEDLAAALVGMSLPEEVLDLLEANFSRLSAEEITATIAVMQKSGRNLKIDPVHNILIGCTSSRMKTRQYAHSDVSTSEGSRSDSEEESFQSLGSRPPPGLSVPAAF